MLYKTNMYNVSSLRVHGANVRFLERKNVKLGVQGGGRGIRRPKDILGMIHKKLV